MFLFNLVQYALAFVFIWIGSGFIISSTSKFSKKLHLSSFAISFVLLGLLTSTPEFSVGIQSIANNTPGIFVGNLLGGLVVTFLLIIPLLAVFGNGINIKNEMGNKTLLLSLGVMLAPSIAVFDKKITSAEGIILIISYLLLVYIFQREYGLFARKKESLLDTKAYSHKDILKLLIGVVILVIASDIIVHKTTYFADIFNIPVFVISLIIIALGTNLPELTLAVRSVLSGKKDIAMGDYLGAGVASTFMFGLFTLLNGGEIETVSNFLITFIFIGGGVVAFYILGRTKGFITRPMGIILIGFYILFIIFEIVLK